MNVLYKGVDISSHNSINWNKVDPKEIDFVIIRAGYGFNTQDKQFKTNIENAIKKGIPVGIYWFSYAGSVEHAKKEAEFCLNVIGAYRKYITLPVFFDWENDSYNYVVKTYKITPTKHMVSDMAIAFLETVKKAGYKVGNYNSVSYLNTYFDDRVKDNYDTWVAHVKDKYGNPLQQTSYKGKYTIHQYSWVGRPSGFNSDTDMDYCFVDYIGGKNTVTTPVTPTTPTYLVDYKKEQASKVVSYNLTTQGNLYLSPHFQVKEFKSPDSNTVKIDNRLIWILEKLYTDFNCSKLIINSGYRTPAYSVKVGGGSTDRHTLGQASDIKLFDKSGKIISAKLVCQKLCEYGNVFGIGYISETSIHVDTRPRENIWFGDETKGVSLIKAGYTDFNGYFNGKTLIVNAGTWNVRDKADVSGKVVAVVKSGSKYTYTKISNGWAYISSLKGWISPKGYAKKE